jgi:tRNA pseudouridine38-40 synthase
VTRTTRFRPPIGREHAHWVCDPLDLNAIRAVAAEIRGRHDFRAFGNTGSPRKSTVRTVRRLRLVPRRSTFAFVVEGDGFLYNMVRTIAGTLIDAGRGRMTAADVREALANGDRTRVGPTAPACGLYLLRVLYAEPAFAGPDAGPRGVPGLFQPTR